MKGKMEITLKEKALWALEGMGIVLAYLGAFAILMYPVAEAIGFAA